MTVATQACYAERIYTGVETAFAPGITALEPQYVRCGYLDRDALPVELQLGVHFTVALDGEGLVTVGRLAFPAASVQAPVTMWFGRSTPAVQGVNFKNLNRYDPGVHERIADAGAMRDAELLDRQIRTVTPFVVGPDVVDFGARRVRAANPVAPSDLVTKSYADENTGTAAAAEAKEYRDEVVLLAGQVSDDAATAEGAKNAAVAAAAILENPDYGFYADVIVSNRDYGTYA